MMPLIDYLYDRIKKLPEPSGYCASKLASKYHIPRKQQVND